VKIEKLQKLIPMLSSENDGEVLATVEAIKRLLKASGKDLHDFAGMLSISPANDNVPEPSVPLEPDDLEMANYCVEFGMKMMSQRECEFVTSLPDKIYRYGLSQKQSDWLLSIYTRIKRIKR
jgi:hypothetical protein